MLTLHWALTHLYGLQQKFCSAPSDQHRAGADTNGVTFLKTPLGDPVLYRLMLVIPVTWEDEVGGSQFEWAQAKA